MQEEKKEKYINGEIYGEKNQIIVTNKSAMIRDKMRSKLWDQRYLKEIINAKKIKNHGRNGRKKCWTERDDGGKGSGKEKVAKNQPIIKQNVKKKDDRVE